MILVELFNNSWTTLQEPLRSLEGVLIILKWVLRFLKSPPRRFILSDFRAGNQTTTDITFSTDIAHSHSALSHTATQLYRTQPLSSIAHSHSALSLLLSLLPIVILLLLFSPKGQSWVEDYTAGWESNPVLRCLVFRSWSIGSGRRPTRPAHK